MSAAPVSQAVAAHAIAPRASGRPWTFYVLLTVFILYVLALYGPMICIYILSFQDVRGGLVFPMKGLSRGGPEGGRCAYRTRLPGATRSGRPRGIGNRR